MLEISNTKDKVFIDIFDNIHDLTTFLKKPRKSGRDNSSESESYDFTGTHSYSEALDLMMYGDEETFKKVIEEKNKIKIDGFLGNVANRQRYENNVYGCVPNIPSYLMGYPIDMINSVKDQPSHKIVNIFLDMSCNAGIGKEDIINAGVKYLSVIDLLEKKGYRCNLYAGVSSKYGYSDYEAYYMLVKVKTDREPLNIKKICFTIANPSFLRRIYFRWAEVFDFESDITGGYGSNLDSDKVKSLFNNNVKDSFIVWCYQDDGAQRCSVEELIKKLKESGITLD